MLMPDLIIRSYRRSLSITITKNADIVVRAPKRLSMDEILKYIKEKEKWIQTKQKEIENRLSFNKEIIIYNQVLFLGKKYNVKFLTSIKKIELTEDSLLIPTKYQEDFAYKIRSWFLSKSKCILKERIEYFANIMQIDYASVSINNSKNRWGSCDSNRNIKLNFRLLMLPHKVLDFVLIHELAHILQFNHSKEFYKIISIIMPSYKLQQKQLKEYDYLLSLYR